MNMYRFLTIGMLALGLSACGTAVMKELAKEIKNLESNSTASSQRTPVRQPALYCYNTLGTVSCYDKPRANEDSRFVGTTVEPIDPEVNSKHIVGEISLPAPVVEESNDSTVKTDGNPSDPVVIDTPKTDAAASPATVPPVMIEKPAPKDMDNIPADTSVPPPAVVVPANTTSVEEMPANKPLSPEALNPPKPVPVEVKAEEQKAAEPIVPPRKKKNVKKSPKASENK